MNIPDKIFSVAEAERQGVARWKLAQMCRDGVIERLSRGIYAPKGHAEVEMEIITLAKHGSEFVVALESALRFHGITTAQATELTVAMKRGARKPTVDFPLRVVRLGQKSLASGVETHVVGGEQIKVFSVAKTVADIFMFRNRIGLGLAIVHSIALAMGGTVNCDTSELGGARFSFSWPLWHNIPQFTSA